MLLLLVFPRSNAISIPITLKLSVYMNICCGCIRARAMRDSPCANSNLATHPSLPLHRIIFAPRWTWPNPMGARRVFTVSDIVSISCINNMLRLIDWRTSTTSCAARTGPHCINAFAYTRARWWFFLVLLLVSRWWRDPDQICLYLTYSYSNSIY